MEIIEENVFNFHNPATMRCSLWFYKGPDVSMLIIRVNNPESDTSEWLTFDQVGYFQGTSGWIGANFTLASKSNQLDLRQRMGQGKLPELAMNTLLEHHHLYVVQPENQTMPIHILATKGYKSLQHHYSGLFKSSSNS